MASQNSRLSAGAPPAGAVNEPCVVRSSTVEASQQGCSQRSRSASGAARRPATLGAQKRGSSSDRRERPLRPSRSDRHSVAQPNLIRDGQVGPRPRRFPEPLANVRTAAPTTCRARRRRAVHVAPVRRLLPRRPCARALALVRLPSVGELRQREHLRDRGLAHLRRAMRSRRSIGDRAWSSRRLP